MGAVGVLEQNRFIALFKSFANLHYILADNKRMGMLVIGLIGQSSLFNNAYENVIVSTLV